MTWLILCSTRVLLSDNCDSTCSKSLARTLETVASLDGSPSRIGGITAQLAWPRSRQDCSGFSTNCKIQSRRHCVLKRTSSVSSNCPFDRSPLLDSRRVHPMSSRSRTIYVLRTIHSEHMIRYMSWSATNGLGNPLDQISWLCLI